MHHRIKLEDFNETFYDETSSQLTNYVQRTKMGPIKVIGAGLCRTGTNSTKVALEHLLKGECHHFFTILWETRCEELVFWRKVASRGENVSPGEWREFFDSTNYVAVMDIPCSLYFENILKAYPEARVILTVRDPAGWHLSIKAVLLEAERAVAKFPLSLAKIILGKTEIESLGFGWTRTVLPGLHHSMASAVDAGEDVSREVFEAWTEKVKSIVPKEKLLVYQVKTGWSPLCQFLGLPVPKDIPFPRQNDARSVLSTIRVYSTATWTAILVGVLSLVAAALKGILHLCDGP